MEIKAQFQITIDMRNKREEINKIINLYLSQMESAKERKAFLETIQDEINKALEG